MIDCIRIPVIPRVLSLYICVYCFVEDSFERKEKSLKQSEADTKKKLKNIEMLAKVDI